MKKLLALSIMSLMFVSSGVFAANSTLDAIKSSAKQDLKTLNSAVKTDIKNVKTDVKNDVKTIKEDTKSKVQSVQNAQAQASEQKKAEKIQQYNAKIDELNKQIADIQASKAMTATEKTMRIAPLQKQVNFYKNQINALK